MKTVSDLFINGDGNEKNIYVTYGCVDDGDYGLR